MTTTDAAAPADRGPADDPRSRVALPRLRADRCLVCGWTRRRRARGGPPELIGSILDDVVHDFGRCRRKVLAARTGARR